MQPQSSAEYVAEFRRKNPLVSVPLTVLEKRQVEDLHWAAASPEVRQHRGNYVVIRDRKIACVGSDRAAAVKEAAAREQCPEWEFVVYVEPADPLADINDFNDTLS